VFALETTWPKICDAIQVLEKVERLKAANIQVDSISKSIQELEANARSQRVVWRFNERYQLLLLDTNQDSTAYVDSPHATRFWVKSPQISKIYIVEMKGIAIQR
jgi:hypothetical protein